MKQIIILLFLIYGTTNFANPVQKDCTYKGKKLFGKVRIVQYGEDFTVRAVTYSEDFKIQHVSYSQTECGKWQFAEYGEDFKIRFVEYSEDFKVKFVEYSPGLP